MMTERKTTKDEHEIQQRMARLAPTDVTSSERWASTCWSGWRARGSWFGWMSR
jgi:hypothetical protein